MRRALELGEQNSESRGDLGDHDIRKLAACRFRRSRRLDLGREGALIEPRDGAAKQRFLGREVMIERLPRHAGLLGGLLDRGAPKSVAAKYPHGGVENAMLGIFSGLHLSNLTYDAETSNHALMTAGRSAFDSAPRCGSGKGVCSNQRVLLMTKAGRPEIQAQPALLFIGVTSRLRVGPGVIVLFRGIVMAATDIGISSAPPRRSSLFGSLFVQVVIALILGILIGAFAPSIGQSLKFFSDAFLKLISMVVAPIVFCVVVHGIASAGDLRKVGRVGVKSLMYFEGLTTVALAFGLVLATVFGPGHGMNIDVAKLDAKQLATFVDNAHKLQGGGFGGFILNIIPSTAFDAFARNDVLQV